MPVSVAAGTGVVCDGVGAGAVVVPVAAVVGAEAVVPGAGPLDGAGVEVPSVDCAVPVPVGAGGCRKVAAV